MVFYKKKKKMTRQTQNFIQTKKRNNGHADVGKTIKKHKEEEQQSVKADRERSQSVCVYVVP